MNMFPPSTVKTTNFARTAALLDLLEKRLGTLAKFLPDGETLLKCDAELEKMTGQQSGRIFRAEFNVQVGGELFRAEATGEKMEDAIERAKNELKKELQRRRGKRRGVFLRGAGRLKGMLRWGG